MPAKIPRTKSAPEMLTAAQVATRCNVTARCVIGWAHRGVIPGASKLGGVWRFGRVELEAWIVRQQRRTPGRLRGRSIDVTDCVNSVLRNAGKDYETRLAQHLAVLQGIIRNS